MKLAAKLCITVAVPLLLTACVTNPRKVSMAEVMPPNSQFASAEISPSVASQPERLYTQPVNKTEPCKVPTNKKQLERKNFRAYWDGDCKGGYAYGLGREIALSDTHHLEEVTVYKGNGDSNGQPFVVVDYVQNRSIYAVKGVDDGSDSGSIENITFKNTDFSVEYTVFSTDGKGRSRFFKSSPFAPTKFIVNRSHGNPDYVLEDFSEFPDTSLNQAEMAIYAANPITGRPIGFRIVHFRGGAIQHQKLAADGKTAVELVELPQEYIAKVSEAISEAQAAMQKASADASKAQQMEREYLHMACAAGYSIKGVPPKDMGIARQICTWREQWKEPFAKAEAKYKQEMEQKRQDIAQSEQQRAYIVAQQAQAAAAEREAFSASMARLNQSLESQTKSAMQQANQMNQQLQYQSNQMMNSWAPQQNTTTVCNRVGNQVICR